MNKELILKFIGGYVKVNNAISESINEKLTKKELISICILDEKIRKQIFKMFIEATYDDIDKKEKSKLGLSFKDDLVKIYEDLK